MDIALIASNWAIGQKASIVVYIKLTRGLPPLFILKREELIQMKDEAKTGSEISRRKFIKATTAAATAATVGPWIISSEVLAASGQINCNIWTDYIPPDVIADFTRKTAIKVNYQKLGSNEELINQMKATKGAGVDLCSPTSNRANQWQDLDLLQPFDYGRISNIRNVNSALLKVGATEWNFDGKGTHLLPLIWGTEAIAWRTDLYSPPGGTPSYGNIWDSANRGKTMIRAYSGMVGAGLYMETIGALSPGEVWKSYTDEDLMRSVWGKITKFCITRQAQIKLFWDDPEGQKNGLLNEGVIVGQAWDGPALAMKLQGAPVAYQAPKEGALAWMDGLAMSAAARNVAEVYELIKYVFDPQVAGKSIGVHGYNSAVMGAENHADAFYRKDFNETYPGKALSQLKPWPTEPKWYVDASTEFTNQFLYA